MDIQSLLHQGIQIGIKVIISLLVLIISFKVLNFLAKKIHKKIHESKKLDETITGTILNIAKVTIKILIVICLVQYLGIDTSGITALITSVGVCFGLAVNGALSNLAGGLLLLVTKPFKIGDFVEIEGVMGTVEEIRIINTKLLTIDNKAVYLPNGNVSAEKVINYSEMDLRRVEWKFDIAYDANMSLAKQCLERLLKSHPLVMQDMPFLIETLEYKESGISILVRAWAKNADYWTVFFDINKQMKEAFDAEGISIPFNQLDVHIINEQK